MTPADRYRETNAALMHGAPNEEGRRNAALTHGARNEERERLSSSGAAGISSLSDSRSPSSHRAPVQHNRLRRKAAHDYSAAGIYLITVTTNNRERLLGKLAGSTPDEACVEPSVIGEYVIEAFRKMAAMVTSKTGTPVQVLQYQLMPDHFHGIIYIREALPKGWSLGKMIGTWKGDCSREYWRINTALTHGARNEEGRGNATLTHGAPDEEGREPLLAAGYNDRILFHEGQLKNWIAYLHDNPRRLWLKMHHPNRLRKVYEFQAGTPEHRYTAIGNTFLVTYPERVQVRCHRNLTEEQIKSEVEHYLTLARSGAVLVSPFISPAEKAVYEACYNERQRMIHIVNRGLDGRFIYPSGRDLEGCSEGFMLVLAPYPDYSAETADTRISRAQCLDMNAYAAELSTNVALTRDAHNDQTPR